jgi:preprotein translocase subunit YajC
VGGFLILIVILAVGYALLVLPRRRRVREHAAMQDSVAVGDEIISAGGLHGHVREIHDATVELEIAPQVVVTLDRRAIAAVAREVEVETETEAAPEPEPENGAETAEEPR